MRQYESQLRHLAVAEARAAANRARPLPRPPQIASRKQLSRPIKPPRQRRLKPWVEAAMRKAGIMPPRPTPPKPKDMRPRASYTLADYYAAGTEHVKLLLEDGLTLTQARRRIGYGFQRMRDILKSLGMYAADVDRQANATYYRARREHAFLLRCENEDWDSIGGRLGISGSAAQKLAQKFAESMQRAVRHTRIAVT